MYLELPGGCRGVDAFAQRDERDAERLQVLEQRDQVLQVASEPIELTSQASNLRRRASFTSRSSAGRRSVEPLTPWSTYSTAASQPRGDVAAELGELVLGLLIEGGHARVGGSSHGTPHRVGAPVEWR
jgi:hypothetical protein